MSNTNTGRVVGIRWDRLLRFAIFVGLIVGVWCIYGAYNAAKSSYVVTSGSANDVASYKVPLDSWQGYLEYTKRTNHGSWKDYSFIYERPFANANDPINLSLFEGIQPGWSAEQINSYLHKEGTRTDALGETPKPGDQSDSIFWYDGNSPTNSPYICVSFKNDHAVAKSECNLVRPKVDKSYDFGTYKLD